MLAEGESVKEIACDLNLSVKTVEAHKFNLMRKLDIHTRRSWSSTPSRRRSSRFLRSVSERGPGRLTRPALEF